MHEEIKIKKNHFFAIAVIILILVFLSVYFFYYAPTQAQKESLLTYKKTLYESIQCQYACPLVERQFQGTNQSLPDVECTKACVTKANSLNISGSEFSDLELLNDNLFADIDSILKNCQSSSTETVQNVTIINNSAFFNCASPQISALKESYEYLN